MIHVSISPIKRQRAIQWTGQKRSTFLYSSWHLQLEAAKHAKMGGGDGAFGKNMNGRH